jgi:DUF4097 and DUF4098 domain-containing protein YvlB
MVDESYSSFKNIEIKADFLERVVLKEGDGFAVRGQNYERYGGLDVGLKSDTLVVNAKADSIWNFNIGIDNFLYTDDSWLEITYPAGTKFVLVKTDLSTGNINLNTIECGELNIKNSFGRITIASVKTDKLNIHASSGDIELNGANVSGNLDISNSFGDVKIENIKAGSLDVRLDSGRLKAAEINADTVALKNSFGEIDLNGVETGKFTITQSSGDINADKVSVREIAVNSSFGKVSIDRLTFAELCKVENSSGDIQLSLLMNRDEVSYELNTSAGSVTVDRSNSSGSVSSNVPGAAATLKASASFGDIRVEFLG